MLGNYEETELHTRLLKPYEEKLSSEHTAIFEASVEEVDNRTFKHFVETTSFDESKEPTIPSYQPKTVKRPVATEYKGKPTKDTQIKSSLAPDFQAKSLETTASQVATESQGDMEAQGDMESQVTTLRSSAAEYYPSEDIKSLLKLLEDTKSQVISREDPKSQIKSQEDTKSQVKFPEPQVKSKVATSSQKLQPKQQLEQAYEDIKTMMVKSKVDLHDREEYATLLLWDFAGDEEFYHTHQTFLSSDAIYLVVSKLNESEDKNAQGKY
ncbi:unnamed protein product [Mytilus edulis]|uniref:Uncharacterized protein n=1 Tax=Mytilus edulis TaxID=6550 RepID=A0A8S3U4Y2_MYTED|nr:unnamed protein product [Mytilus edulis]